MSKYYRLTKSGFSNFLRNGWLGIASITIMVLTLITMSLFLILNVVLSEGIKTLQEKIDISVYFSDEAKQANIIDIQEELAEQNNVKSIKYISKSDALSRYREQNKDNPKLLESLEGIDNPLPASLEIKVNNPDLLDDLTVVFEKEEYIKYIHKVSYKENKQIIDKLFKATKFTKQIGIVATGAFIATALVIIFNTIKIAIISRKEEIEIMKLVGATPGFIKGPFIIEGAIYGIISTIISVMAIATALYFLSPAISKYFGGVGDEASVFLRDNIALLIILQVITGTLIGVLSSWLAVRKYVKFN